LLSFSDRWNNIIKNCKIDLTKSINIINTADIHKFGEKETRLMTSIGTESRLPDIFKKYGVFVIPVSMKQVAIVKGKGFHAIEQINSAIQIHTTEFAFPASLQDSQGEAGFLNYAYYSGLLSKFTRKPNLRPGFAGKRRVYFDFRVDGSPLLKIDGAQMEVDASYESDDKYFLIEAKYKTPKSFNIKQLYYPYKYFLPKMKSMKIKNIFFAYEPTQNEYRFWEYNFKNPNDFEQINFIKNARYKINFTKKTNPLKEYAIKPVKMRAIQANDVHKMMDLPFAIIDGANNSKMLAKHFDFDERQSAYYSDAMRTLGFIINRGSRYILTEIGEKYVNLPVEKRTKFFLRRLVEYPPVSEIIHKILLDENIGDTEMQEIVAKHDATITKSTIARRAQCYKTWFKFIANTMGYCIVKNGIISRINQKETLNGF